MVEPDTTSVPSGPKSLHTTVELAFRLALVVTAEIELPFATVTAERMERNNAKVRIKHPSEFGPEAVG